MRPRVERIDRRGHVYTVGCADADPVGLDLLEHRLPVFEQRVDAPFRFEVVQPARVDIDPRDDFHIGQFPHRAGMHLGDPAATDDRDPEFFSVELGRRTDREGFG